MTAPVGSELSGVDGGCESALRQVKLAMALVSL